MAILLIRGRGLRETVESEAVPRAGQAIQTVSLTIDFADGQRQQYEPTPWYDGMTVYDLLRETPRPDFRLELRGFGPSALLMDLDGVRNEGADGRNWTYRVNGQHADRSFAVYELRPGDLVLWTFAAQQ